MWKEVGLVALGLIGGIGLSVTVMILAESLHEIRNGISHLRDSIGTLTTSHNALRHEVKEQATKIAKLAEVEPAPKVVPEPAGDPDDDEEEGGIDRSI